MNELEALYAELMEALREASTSSARTVFKARRPTPSSKKPQRHGGCG
ncbi:hypothetical protein ACDW_12950 [Acidovorax sp. DW039]|nr:hypothetical protein ACDW_12950 [Acidovorax sp. DW039]